MKNNKRIAVVVPAYNEEKLISRVITTMPEYVDAIYVVDDASKDGTAAIVEQLANTNPNRVHLVKLEKNSGVGAAITRGYREAVKGEADVVAVMAGDAQMNPDDLENLLQPVVDGSVDYSKGNRLFTGEAWQIIPRYRYLGNAFLSLLTKISSGYWHLADSQTGFTAISARALKLLPLEELYPRYGYPNHILAMLNVYNMKVRDVPVQPVYNIGEKSGIRLWRVAPSLSILLAKNFIWRITQKYVIRDFHPLVFFYSLALLLLTTSLPLGVRLVARWIAGGNIPPINALALMFTVITGVQSLFFAMWFDMEYNKDLR
jgi:glycosyltransferase involved in cell wall biosynthesis